MIGVYVNDLLIAARITQKVQEIKNMLNRAFEIKDLGETRVIIGIRVIKDRFKGILILDQTSYVHQVLVEEGMRDYLLSDVPIKAELYVELTEAEDTKNADIETY